VDDTVRTAHQKGFEDLRHLLDRITDVVTAMAKARQDSGYEGLYEDGEYGKFDPILASEYCVTYIIAGLKFHVDNELKRLREANRPGAG
jgi:hypothetical protein